MSRKVAVKGITLAEALVAQGILIMAVMLIMELFSGSFFGISTARETGLASQIAREKLEHYLRRGYAWIQTQPATVAGTTTVATRVEGRSRSTTFEYAISHKPVEVGGLDEVDVKVSWSRRGSPQGSGNFILLSSWVAR